jgi:hypothetical protein
LLTDEPSVLDSKRVSCVGSRDYAPKAVDQLADPGKQDDNVPTRAERGGAMRVRRTLAALTVAIAMSVTLSPTAAQAGGRPLSTVLSGSNEVPAADPDGSGVATLQLNPGQRTICYQLQVSGIALPAAAAHIHRAGVGVNGPVVVPLTAPDADGTSSGCAEADRDLVRAIVMDPQDYYVNVHNAEFPGGAVRGQLG